MDSREHSPARVAGRYAIFDAIATGGMASVCFGRLVGPKGFSRTVVIKRLHPQFVGDADFASDAYYDLLGNANLVLNAIAWLAREDALEGAREKQIPEIERPLSPLVLTEAQSRQLLIAMVVVQPVLVLALGVGVVARRRWRG